MGTKVQFAVLGVVSGILCWGLLQAANARQLDDRGYLVVPAHSGLLKLMAVAAFGGATYSAWRSLEEESQPQPDSRPAPRSQPAPTQAATQVATPIAPQPEPVATVRREYGTSIPDYMEADAEIEDEPEPEGNPLIEKLLWFAGIGSAEPQGAGIFLACTNGSGKTTVLSEFTHQLRERTGGKLQVSAIDGKGSYWGAGTDDPFEDGQPNAIVIDDSGIEEKYQFYVAARDRLVWYAKKRAARAKLRMQMEATGRRHEYRPQPLLLIVDEWNHILSPLSRTKPSKKGILTEIYELCEEIADIGIDAMKRWREDGLLLAPSGQSHQKQCCHIPTGDRDNMAVIGLGGNGDYRSIEKILDDGWLISSASVRRDLQEQYDTLRHKGQRIYYCSIGGHHLGVTPHMEKQTAIFEKNNVIQGDFGAEQEVDPWTVSA